MTVLPSPSEGVVRVHVSEGKSNGVFIVCLHSRLYQGDGGSTGVKAPCLVLPTTYLFFFVMTVFIAYFRPRAEADYTLNAALLKPNPPLRLTLYN